MKNFRCYQQAVELYHACQKVRAPGHLRDQLMRASSSVVLNLAEGWGKRTNKERRRFFDIALGSLRETQAILQLCDSGLHQRADRLGAQLYCLIRAQGS